MVDKSVSALIILGERTHGFCHGDKEESDSQADDATLCDGEASGRPAGAKQSGDSQTYCDRRAIPLSNQGL